MRIITSVISRRERGTPKLAARRQAHLTPSVESLEGRVVPATTGQVCTDAIDLMILVDGSSSIGSANFELEKQAVQQLVASFTLGPSTAHIGVIEFSDKATMIIGLSGDATSVNTAVAGMPYIGYTTNMTAALTMAQQEIATHGRPGIATPLILLMTDGQPTDPNGYVTPESIQAALDAGTAAKSAGTLIFAAGIGSGVSDTFLEQLVSPPPTQFYYKAPDFSGLPKLIDQVATTTCTIAEKPQVIGFNYSGIHTQPTQIALAFNQAMDPTSVQDTANYVLLTRSHHQIRVVSATYSQATQSVTLVTAQHLNIHHHYKLIVNGSGVKSATGGLLDGVGNGTAGTDYVKKFDIKSLVLPRNAPKLSTFPRHWTGAVRNRSLVHPHSH